NSQGRSGGRRADGVETKYIVAGNPHVTNRFRITLAERVIIDVWCDQQNMPLIFFIEGQGIKAVRGGSEGLAEAVDRERNDVVGRAFNAEHVTFKNAEVTLAGTLTIPTAGTPPFPAVLLISGSGLQDRDDNPGGHGFFRLIAERLSSNGIAVLRHDDRGFGKSSALSKPSSYQDLIGDTRAGILYLRGRKQIDARRIVLVGHSEGAETAAILADEDSRIAGIVLLAGVSRPLDLVVLEQAIYYQALKGPVDPSSKEKFPDVFQRLMRIVTEAKAGKADESVNDLNEYFRQHAAHDPSETIKKLRCPILILQGERDMDALVYHSIALALAASSGGNKHVSVRIVPDIGHDFAASPLDARASVEERNQPSKEILNTLEAWVARLLLSKESR
ncbi:MAG TPA: alpha/beta fold hydrolase, partial [Blastocatellia bacterium]|nr:alpha/beta fold hydrolase [Blastocatellia bacterium]